SGNGVITIARGTVPLAIFEPVAVVLENGERHGPAGDGDDAVAGAMQDGEGTGRHSAAGRQDDSDTDRMSKRREPRRHYWMEAAEHACLEDPGPHLRRTDQ